MRKRKRKSRSGSGWIAIVAVVLLAAVAWNAYRTPSDAPVIAETPTSASSRDGITTTALELPPMADTAPATRADNVQAETRYPDFLPAQAIDTLQLIERGGPYPYRQDDGVFGNRENRLPRQSRGYYREFTVETPGSRDRGARRIIAGGRPPVEYFYTDDHYDSFRRFTLNGAALDPAAQNGTETPR
jgi:ribonuclease T1